MSSPAENVAKLKDAYRQWHESKGGSVKLWLDLMADHVRVRSLAAGAPDARFTSQVNSKAELEVGLLMHRMDDLERQMHRNHREHLAILRDHNHGSSQTAMEKLEAEK